MNFIFLSGDVVAAAITIQRFFRNFRVRKTTEPNKRSGSGKTILEGCYITYL